MKIQKALSHFEWRLVNKNDKGEITGLKNNLKPSLTDIEALNSIIQWKEHQESLVLSQNESLAKLFIHQLILLNSTKLYSGERSIQVIDEILDKSVYEWCIKLKDNINLMNFNAILNDNNILDDCSIIEFDKWRENASKQVENNQELLKESLIKEVETDNIIKFIKKQVNRIINKYEK